MRRGTTPTLRLSLRGLSTFEVLKDIYVTLSQGELQLTKTTDSIVVDDENKLLIVKLTEGETLAFKASPVAVQVRATTQDGNAIATNIKQVSMHDILYEEEITDGTPDSP